MRVWAMLALCACASQRSAESHADYVAQTQTTRTEGAERTVVVEEFEVRRQGQPEGGARHTPYIPTPGSATSGVVPAVPDTGQLLRRTTTISREPVVTETHSGLDVKTDAESASSSSFLKLSLWTKILLALGLLALAFLAYRFRAGLLGGVLKVIGR